MCTESGSERVHALDHLRASMMWLGIVLHASINHLAGPSPVPWSDPATSPLANLLTLFIHAFRMPSFFLLAGYLAAAMVATRGVRALVRHRLRRVALPFALFWPVLLLLMAALVLVYAHLMSRGTIGFDPALAPQRPPGSAALPTMHLWFVCYLFWVSMLAAMLCALQTWLPGALVRAWRAGWDAALEHGWGVLLLALPLTLAGASYNGGILAPDGALLPNWREMLHNGIFFALGWHILRLRDSVVPRLRAHYWKYLLSGAVSFLASLVLIVGLITGVLRLPLMGAWIAFAYSLTGCLWSLGLVGLFFRYLDRQHALLRYLSDSSYWVFLVHLLGTTGCGILLFNAPLGAPAKIAINVVATSVLCLLSYQLLVRRSWIGLLLNGKRHCRTAPSTAWPQSRE